MAGNNGVYQYKALFSVDVSHTWYADQHCKDIVIQPTFHTLEMLKGLPLEFRPTSTGFMIIYDENRTDSLLNYIAINGRWSRLSFIMTAATPYFNNFTQLPTDLLQKTLYLSNTQAHTGIDTKELIYLHPGAYEKGAQSYRVITSEVKVVLPDEQIAYIVDIIDIAGQVVISRTSEAGKGMSAIYIDLSLIPEGRYTIHLEAEETGEIITNDPFVYIASNTPALGFIDILLEDPSNENPFFFPVWEDTITAKYYGVSFEGRATNWKYFIVFPGKRTVNGLFIKSIGNEFSFSAPEKVNIGNGVNAYLFVSCQKIPLKEVSPYKFKLFENISGGIDEEVVGRLPVAGISQVLPIEEDVFSPIYVTV